MLVNMMILVSNWIAAMKREEGQGMAEYGLILALIAVVVIAALTALGGGIQGILEQLNAQFPGAL